MFLTTSVFRFKFCFEISRSFKLEWVSSALESRDILTFFQRLHPLLLRLTPPLGLLSDPLPAPDGRGAPNLFLLGHRHEVSPQLGVGVEDLLELLCKPSGVKREVQKT